MAPILNKQGDIFHPIAADMGVSIRIKNRFLSHGHNGLLSRPILNFTVCSKYTILFDKHNLQRAIKPFFSCNVFSCPPSVGQQGRIYNIALSTPALTEYA